MTIDERLEKLTAAVEKLEASQTKTEAMQAKTQIMLAEVVDTMKRLERIAIIHEVRLDDVDATLARLEARRAQ